MKRKPTLSVEQWNIWHQKLLTDEAIHRARTGGLLVF